MELSKADTSAIKGIAILLMLWHHLFLSTTEYGTLTQSLAIVFKVCVALFLFVSGYGLTRQYSGLDKRNIRTTVKFLLRRFINFFLPYWFCFVLVVLVGNICGYTFHDAYPATRNTLKCFLLDIWGQMGYDSYLSPWWFNKMIIQLYLIFPLLCLIVYNKYSAIVGLVAIAILQLSAKSLPGNVFFVVEGGTPAFFLGMLIAKHRIMPVFQKRSWRIGSSLVSCLMIIALSVLLVKLIKDPYQAILLRAILALCIVCAYKSFSTHHSSIMEHVGKYAAIMYLIHVLFIKIIPQVIYSPRCSLLIFVLFTIICLGTAWFVAWLEKVSHYDKLRLALVNRLNSLL